MIHDERQPPTAARSATTASARAVRHLPAHRPAPAPQLREFHRIQHRQPRQRRMRAGHEQRDQPPQAQHHEQHRQQSGRASRRSARPAASTASASGTARAPRPAATAARSAPACQPSPMPFELPRQPAPATGSPPAATPATRRTARRCQRSDACHRAGTCRLRMPSTANDQPRPRRHCRRTAARARRICHSASGTAEASAASVVNASALAGRRRCTSAASQPVSAAKASSASGSSRWPTKRQDLVQRHCRPTRPGPTGSTAPRCCRSARCDTPRRWRSRPARSAARP